MPRKEKVQKDSSVSRRNGDLTAWIATCKKLYRCGGFSTQLETLRFQFRKKNWAILEPYASENWLGWCSPPGRCCLAIATVGQELFGVEKKRLEEVDPDDAGLLTAEAPLEVTVEHRGRCTLLPQLAVCAGIAENSMIFVIFRLKVIEIWNPRHLSAYCRERGMAVLWALNPCFWSYPTSPILSRPYPGNPVHKPS